MGAEGRGVVRGGADKAMGEERRVDSNRRSYVLSGELKTPLSQSIALFEPEALDPLCYYPSPDVLTVVSRAELDMCRAGEWIGRSAAASVVNDYLINLDTVASSKISGHRISLMDAFSLGAADICCEHGIPVSDLVGEAPRVAPQVEGFRSLLRSIHSDAGNPPSTRELFERMRHELVENGEAPMEYRSHSASRLAGAAPSPEGHAYSAPEPERIPEAIVDLAAFCDQPYATPIIHTSVAHFKFEAIAPFDDSMDYMGRLLCYAIFYRRGLMGRLCLPIAIFASTDVPFHAEVLLPYRSQTIDPASSIDELIDRFVKSCARSCECAVDVAVRVAKAVQAMKEAWRGKFEAIRPDSALNAVLDILPVTPTFNVDYLMAVTSRSQTALNGVIGALLRAGIVEKTSEGRRNRLFTVPAVVHLIEVLEKSLFGDDSVSRDECLVPLAP